MEVGWTGYIITDRDQKTRVDIAAGDVCKKFASGGDRCLGMEAVAATSLNRYVSGRYEKPELAG